MVIGARPTGARTRVREARRGILAANPAEGGDSLDWPAVAGRPVARGRRPRGGGILCLALLASACGSSPAALATSRATSTSSAAAPGAAASPDALDLTMALGQTVGVAFSGREVTPALRHLIVDLKVGTVVLLPGNFAGAGGLRHLTAELGALGREAGLPAPLLVCLNQEGGRASAVSDGVPAMPSELVLGAGGPGAVRSAMAATARGLRSLGVGLDLAPVSDIRTNPADGVIGDRAFGSTAAVVAPLVAAAVEGLHDGGVGSTVKHFPGLGGQAGDPHVALTTDPMSLTQWQDTHAVAIGAGIGAGTDAVMTTEVVGGGPREIDSSVLGRVLCNGRSIQGGGEADGGEAQARRGRGLLGRRGGAGGRARPPRRHLVPRGRPPRRADDGAPPAAAAARSR